MLVALRFYHYSNSDSPTTSSVHCRFTMDLLSEPLHFNVFELPSPSACSFPKTAPPLANVTAWRTVPVDESIEVSEPDASQPRPAVLGLAPCSPTLAGPCRNGLQSRRRV